MKILVLNAGSSSQKNALYEITGDSLPGQASTPLWEASIDWSHQAGRAEVKVQTATGATYQNSLETESRSEAVTQVLATLWQGETKVIETPTQIDAVGHRVVHG